MSQLKVCPVCLSENLGESVNTVSAVAVFGSPVDACERRTICKNCGSIVEADENAFTTAMDASVKSSIPEMVEFLEHNHKFTLGEIEVSLGLSRHSLSKWKYSKIMSAPSLALLRIMRRFPFVIDAAANNFSEEASDNLLCREFLRTMEKKVEARRGLSHSGAFGFMGNAGGDIGFAAVGIAFKNDFSNGLSGQVSPPHGSHLSGVMA
jgi:hypothetical protein